MFTKALRKLFENSQNFINSISDFPICNYNVAVLFLSTQEEQGKSFSFFKMGGVTSAAHSCV